MPYGPSARRRSSRGTYHPQDTIGSRAAQTDSPADIQAQQVRMIQAISPQAFTDPRYVNAQVSIFQQLGIGYQDVPQQQFIQNGLAGVASQYDQLDQILTDTYETGQVNLDALEAIYRDASPAEWEVIARLLPQQVAMSVEMNVVGERYDAARRDDGGGGLFSGVPVIGAVEGAVREVPGLRTLSDLADVGWDASWQAGGEALRVWDEVSRLPTRAYRAASMALGDGRIRWQWTPAGFLPTPGEGVEPGEFASAVTVGVVRNWEAAADGSRVVRPATERAYSGQIRTYLQSYGVEDETLERQLYEAGIEIASGSDLDETVDAVFGTREQIGDQAYDSAWLTLNGIMGDPENGGFRDAVETWSEGTFTVGQDIASDLGFDEGTTAHNLFSGTYDAALLISGDPTLLAGKGIQVVRGARWAVAADDPARLATVIGGLSHTDEGFAARNVLTGELLDGGLQGGRGSVHAWLDETTRFIGAASDGSADNYAELVRHNPAFGSGVWDSFVDWRATQWSGRNVADDFTRHDLAEFFYSLNGQRAIAARSFGRGYGRQFLMPHITRAGRARIWTRDAVHGAMSMSEQGARWGNPAGSVFDRAVNLVTAPIRRVGDALQTVTQQIARGQGHQILEGPTAIDEFARNLNTVGRAAFIPQAERDLLLNAFSSARGVAGRRDVVLKYHQAIADHLGHLDVADNAMSQFWQRIVARENYQRYAVEGLDLLPNGSRMTPTGVLIQGHSAQMISTPDMFEMLEATRKATITRRVFGMLNNRAVDAFMTDVWKPAVLMRIAFVPRAAGEEFLNFMLRRGPAGYLLGKAAEVGWRPELFQMEHADIVGTRLLARVGRKLEATAARVADPSTLNPQQVLGLHMLDLAGRGAQSFARGTSSLARRSARGYVGVFGGPRARQAMELAARNDRVARAFLENVGTRGSHAGLLGRDAEQSLYRFFDDTGRELALSVHGATIQSFGAYDQALGMAADDFFVRSVVNPMRGVVDADDAALMEFWLAEQGLGGSLPEQMAALRTAWNDNPELARLLDKRVSAASAQNADEVARVTQQIDALAVSDPAAVLLAQWDSRLLGEAGWRNLITHDSEIRVLAAGDFDREFTQRIEQALRSPEGARYWNRSSRSTMTRDGNVVAPVADGYFRTYAPMVHVDEIPQLRSVDVDDVLARIDDERVRSAVATILRDDPAATDRIATVMSARAPGLIPVGRWTTTDPRLAEAVANELARIAGTRTGFGYVDLPTDFATRWGVNSDQAIREFADEIYRVEAAWARNAVPLANADEIQDLNRLIDADLRVWWQGLDGHTRNRVAAWLENDYSRGLPFGWAPPATGQVRLYSAAPAATSSPPPTLGARIEDTATGGLAVAHRATNSVRLNRTAIQADWDRGMRWLHGGGVSGTRAQARRQAFAQMHIDNARLRAWLNTNGGVDSYAQFLAHREQARLALGRSVPAGGVTPAAVQLEMDVTAIALQQMGVNLDSIAAQGSRVMLGEFGPATAAFTDDLDTALAMVDELDGAALHYVDLPAGEAKLARSQGQWYRLDAPTSSAAARPAGDLGALPRHYLDRITTAVHGFPAAERRQLLDLWNADRSMLATGVLPDAAIRDAAQVNLRHMRTLVADQHDRLMNDAWQALAHGTLDDNIAGVEQIKRTFQNGRRPAYVTNPNVDVASVKAAAVGGKWKRFVRAYFDNVIGRSIDTIIRSPAYWATWIDAFGEGFPLLDDMARRARVHPDIAPGLSGLTDDWEQLDEFLRRPDVHLSRMDGDEFTTLASEAGVRLNTIPVGDLPEGLVNYQRALKNSEQVVVEGALQNTLNQIVPFIDDHRFRSVFAVQMRGLMPFFFAEEQFFKRWMRTLAADPGSFRRAQLTMHGIREMGWVETDENGREVFHYPGAEYVGEAVGQIAARIPGLNLDPTLVGAVSSELIGQTSGVFPGARSPVGGLFMGNASQVDYGTQSIGLAPIVTIAVNEFVNRMPENRLARGLQRTFIPEFSHNRGILQQLVPTTVVDLVQAFAGDNAALASARLQAIQQLAATGQMPDESEFIGNPVLEERFYDQVDDLARVILATRALYGYVAPARPSVEIDQAVLGAGGVQVGQDDPFDLFAGDSLVHELQAYLQHVPLDEAMTMLVDKYGENVTPWTVYQSERTTRSPLPATDEWMEWFTANRGAVEQYPLAATWFGPLSTGDGDAYSQEARLTQLSSGLRVLKENGDFVQDIFVARSSQTYWDAKDAHDAALAAIGDDSELRRAEEANWSQWSAVFLSAHPVFAQALTSGEARQRRAQTIDQMTALLTDPDAPGFENSTAVGFLHENFLRWRVQDARLSTDQSTVGRQARDAERLSFIGWATSYAALNPTVAAYWNSVLRIEARADERAIVNA